MKPETRDRIIVWLVMAAALAVTALIASECAPAHAQTSPAAPTNLTACSGPGRTIGWEMGWDTAAGYGPDSLTVNMWRKVEGGPWELWRFGKRPSELGCTIVYGKWGCLDKITWKPTKCGPAQHYRCAFETYAAGCEPSKDYIWGAYFCDPGGCAPPMPRLPVSEPELYCLNNGGQGCESDYHPVVQP